MRPFAYGLAVRLYCSALLHQHNIAPLVNSFFVLLPLLHFALNQNLTKCAYWNSEDDYLYAYKDGVLTKGTLRLGLLHHYIFINDWQYQTAYGTPTLNGFSPLSNYITVEGGKIKTNLIATNGYYCSLRTEPIENNYNKIIIKGNFGTRTLDTSNFASVYLYLLNYTNNGTSVYYAFASSGLSSPITSCNGATQPLVLLTNNTANVPMVYLIDEIYVEQSLIQQ